jgi:hypothetical protein
LRSVGFSTLFAGLLLLASTQSGCVTGGGSASVPPSPVEDHQYAPVVERWTRKVHVFSKFQNRVEISAVLLADEMRRAVAERLARLRGNTDGLSVLTDSSGGVRLGMLVSVFTPEGAYLDLDDKSLWSLTLRIGPNQQAPMYVRRVNDKTPLKPFFSHIHQWSQDYLLVFDFPETALQKENDAQKVPTVAEFTAQSPVARVELRWP